METLSSSGKNSSSKNEPWKLLESGEVRWDDFSAYERELIVRHYAPKIKILALRLKGKLPQQVDLNELLSAGTLGLIECLGKFKPELNIKFETYAENRIKGAMLDELRRMDWFSRGLRQRVRTLEEAIRKVESRTGRKASKAELREETGLSEKEVEAGLGALQNQLCLSLDAIQDHFSPDQNAHHDNEPYKSTALQDIIDKIASLIDELTMREKLVLSLYYTEELNMRETAEVMGITEGRVSQLHSQALKKLKKKFRASYGQE
ncbi:MULTISPECIES: FliA/WhiG family RNA polymerase sigma factor [Desulfobaculum]|jgi:RNA polymerase sigma factor for flagellar operon FliA|uniref:FliA/WhiG family RNA polymerase sigma factor n=1 Tax=Desulfobaculum sp. SPO524 TaxID=3378071 RepID=UPI0038527CDE